MSETPSRPVFLVDVSADPVLIRIEGRACFQNSGCVRQFMLQMMGEGRRRFVLDCRDCSGMDSTFLGVLAGAAIELRRRTPAGNLVVARAGARILELMRNLGLHRLVTLDMGETAPVGSTAPLPCTPPGEVEGARLVLEAHENLVAADEANRGRFQDVLAFLRNRVQQP